MPRLLTNVWFIQWLVLRFLAAMLTSRWWNIEPPKHFGDEKKTTKHWDSVNVSVPKEAKTPDYPSRIFIGIMSDKRSQFCTILGRLETRNKGKSSRFEQGDNARPSRQFTNAVFMPKMVWLCWELIPIDIYLKWKKKDSSEIKLTSNGVKFQDNWPIRVLFLKR